MKKEHIIYEDSSLACRLNTIDFFFDTALLEEHFHSEVEIVRVESGEISCTVSGEDFTLSYGNVLLVGSSVIHRLKYANAAARVSYIQINIDSICDTLFPDSSLFSYFCAARSKKYGVFLQESNIGRLFDVIKSELEEKQMQYSAAIKGCAFQLAAFMAREGLIEDVSLFSHDSSYKKILPALKYAKENYAEKVTLDGLCEELMADKYNFCKQFKRATGTTFFDYLTFVRLKCAEELLLTSEKNITEISLACGFSTVQYFNRVFRARYDVSPTAYRNMFDERNMI